MNGAQGPVAGVLQSTMVPSSGGSYPMRHMESTGLSAPAFAARATEVTVDVTRITDESDTLKSESQWKHDYTVSEGQV